MDISTLGEIIQSQTIYHWPPSVIYHHTPEGDRPQLHHCRNLKTHTTDAKPAFSLHQEILQSHFTVCLRLCELQYISTDWLRSVSHTLTEYNILIRTNGQALAICCIKQILTVNQTKYMISVYSALGLKSTHQFVVYTTHSNKPYTPNTIILSVPTLQIGCDCYVIISQSAY
jgi:hypothetical protein